MEIFLLWIVLSFLAGWIAEKKGRSAAGYFFLSLFLSPLVGLIAAAAATKNHDALEQAAVKSGTHRKCPMCAELVRQEAIKCRHCGADLSPTPEVKPDPVRPSPLVYKTAKAAGRAVAQSFNRVEIITSIGIVFVGALLLYLYIR